MGQATVELPDPLQQDNAAAPSGSADDLLAQLAGEEIDRILADTEQPATPQAAAAPVTSEPTADTASGSATADAQQTIGGQLDALFHTLNEPTAEEESQAPEPATDQTPAELDAELADQAKQVVPGEPAAEETPAPVVPVESTSAKAANPAPAAAIPSTEAEESKDSAAINELLKEDSAQVPLVLKPLVWLNAPFASLSSGARNSAGWIAIVTMLNAVAILIYVLVFRKH